MTDLNQETDIAKNALNVFINARVNEMIKKVDQMYHDKFQELENELSDAVTEFNDNIEMSHRKVTVEDISDLEYYVDKVLDAKSRLSKLSKERSKLVETLAMVKL